MRKDDNVEASSISSAKSPEDLSSENSEAESSEEFSSEVSSEAEDSDSDPDSDLESEPEEVPFSNTHRNLNDPGVVKPGVSPIDATPPYKGTKITRSHNMRKRDIKKMRALKAQGLLEPNASLADYRQYREGRTLRDDSSALQGEQENDTVRAEKLAETTNREVNSLFRDIESVLSPKKKTERQKAAVEFQQRRQALINNLADGGVDVTPYATADQSVDVTTDSASSTTLKHITQEDPVLANGQSALEKDSERAQKRARLDVAGSRRLLFGSLGVRNPKTKADEEKTRAKLVENANKVPKAKPQQTLQAKEEVDPLSDIWKDSIVLTAEECVEHGIELSAPPYPFVQRWDTQQQYDWTVNPAQFRKNRKRKRKHAQNYGNGDYVGYEYGANYGDEEGAEDDSFVSLNYDDEVVEDSSGNSVNNISSRQKTTQDFDNAVQNQLLGEMSAGSASQSTSQNSLKPLDLPMPPHDSSSLAPLNVQNARSGAIICYKLFEVSAATKWAPAFSPLRTATIVEVLEDDTLVVTLALRDRVRHRFDAKGNRILDRFETGDEDDEDDGVRDVALAAMVEAKLLRPAGVHVTFDDDRKNEGVKKDSQTSLVEETQMENAAAGAETQKSTKSSDGERNGIEDDEEVEAQISVGTEGGLQENASIFEASV